MGNKLVAFLKKRQLTIAVAESYTGGLFSATLTKQAGASHVFKGSIVAYSLESKVDLLHIDPALLATHGSVSSECGVAMAKQAQALFNSHIALSFTGNAGPAASEGKPIGMVYITLVVNEEVHQFILMLEGSRIFIQKQSIAFATKQLFDIISKV